MHVDADSPSPVRQAPAQIDVRADTTRNQESQVPRLLDGSNALGDERVDNRRLERGGQIRALRLSQCAAGFLLLALDNSPHGSFQPAEAHVEPAIDKWPGEAEACRVTNLGQPGDCRPARVRQPEQAGHLVERLARGVVARVAEQAVAAEAGNIHEHAVPARYEQCNERKLQCLGFESADQEMRLHMVDRHRRYAEPVSRRCGKGASNHQRADQAGAGCIGYAIEVLGAHSGLVQDARD